MMVTDTPPQPAGPVPHGRHCAGGTPGWKCCRACAVEQSKRTVAFWETMGGVPDIVEFHIRARIASYG